MTISSQAPCFEARRKCGVGFIHTQLASSYANAPQQLASSPSTVGLITRDFHALISRQHSQTNRRGLHTLFLTSKSRCMQKFSPVDALLTTKRVVLIRSLRRRPYRMKPTAVGFISLTTVVSWEPIVVTTSLTMSEHILMNICTSVLKLLTCGARVKCVTEEYVPGSTF